MDMVDRLKQEFSKGQIEKNSRAMVDWHESFLLSQLLAFLMYKNELGVDVRRTSSGHNEICRLLQ